jgi:hypothetical protein
MELKMNNNLASNADQNCALKEEELDAVSGGRVSTDYLKEAKQDFARGDFLGGFQALSQYTPPPAPPSGGWW